MPTSSATTTDEVRLAARVPLWTVPGWRERFGVTAGVTGRGDDPDNPFDLGLHTGQPVAAAMSRWREFRSAFPEFRGQVMAHQVHGSRVLWHEHSTGWTIHDDADGHATATAGLLLLVTVADCVPIYLVAPEQRAVALLHSGWRGTAAGILEAGVSLLRQRVGVEPAGLVMHLGVAISGPCYEVGSEVVKALGGSAEGAGPWHADIRGRLMEQGLELGIGEVSQSSHCTATASQSFFSHRHSGGSDGRMVAWLGLLPGDRDRQSLEPDKSD